MGKHRYLYFEWNKHVYGPTPARGWPHVLAWIEETSEVRGDASYRELIRLAGVPEIPPQYSLFFTSSEDNPAGKILSPEKLLERREKNLERKASKFPLFPDFIKKEEKAKNPEKYTLDKCRENQSKRREIMENANITPEWFEARMKGSDEWKNHDWTAIRKRQIRELKRQVHRRKKGSASQ